MTYMIVKEMHRELNFTSCVISDKMISIELSSKFSELVISISGNSSGYLSVYVNWMTQDAEEKQHTSPDKQTLW